MCIQIQRFWRSFGYGCIMQSKPNLLCDVKLMTRCSVKCNFHKTLYWIDEFVLNSNKRRFPIRSGHFSQFKCICMKTRSIPCSFQNQSPYTNPELKCSNNEITKWQFSTNKIYRKSLDIPRRSTYSSPCSQEAFQRTHLAHGYRFNSQKYWNYEMDAFGSKSFDREKTHSCSNDSRNTLQGSELSPVSWFDGSKTIPSVCEPFWMGGLEEGQREKTEQI